MDNSQSFTTGFFIDVVGLAYDNGSHKGFTSKDGAYDYLPGKPVTFSIGDLVLGVCTGRLVTTVSSLVTPDVGTFDPSLINRARLLYSLFEGEGFEKVLDINETIRSIVPKHISVQLLDATDLSTLDAPLASVCSELKVQPKSVAHTRNHLRREVAGFKVLRDLQIQSPDGGFVLADAYLPLQPGGRFPVLVSCTLYGRRVPWGGPDVEKGEIPLFEEAEDTWHSTPVGTRVPVPDRGPWSDWFHEQRGFENLATFNSFTYVPQGFAMVRVDPKGVNQTPGARWVPGELAGDFFTAVEWCADQPWSTGHVAMVGSSYGANTQWAVAELQPKGLKCFVPYATDCDSYRDAAYIGGVPASPYLRNWFARVRGISPRWNDSMEAEQLMLNSKTSDGLWKLLATDAASSSQIPCFLAASQLFMIHGRAAYEAWLKRDASNTHLQVVDCDYYGMPSQESSGKIIQFLNHYLRDESILAPEKVGVQVRLGNHDFYWRKESTWPVPGTRYQKWHLQPDLSLSEIDPQKSVDNKILSYSAHVSRENTPAGLTFYSEALDTDIDLVGHFKARLSVSSTDPDADVAVLLWAIDENGQAVEYGVRTAGPQPIAKGFLRVSHRKQHDKLSLPFRPWHTHEAADLLPLQGADDVAEIEIEILPAAARVRKGWKLRLDVAPSDEQSGLPGDKPDKMRDWYGESTARDSLNYIHFGESHENFVSLPVVPTREVHRNHIS